MSLKHANVTVGTSATRLTDVPSAFDSRSLESKTLVIQNTSSVDVFLGDSSVTATVYGYKLAAGADVSLDIEIRDALYARVAAGTAVIHILTIGG